MVMAGTHSVGGAAEKYGLSRQAVHRSMTRQGLKPPKASLEIARLERADRISRGKKGQPRDGISPHTVEIIELKQSKPSMSYSDIAAALGVPRTTVAGAIFRHRHGMVSLEDRA